MPTATETERSTDSDASDRTTGAKLLRYGVIAGGVLVALALAGVAYFFLRPEVGAVSIDDAVAGARGGEQGGTEQAATPVPLDGDWTVDTTSVDYELATSTGTFLGFRIDEELSSLGAITAVGRTPAVTGGITVEGTTLTAASFTADFTELRTDDSRRDSHARNAVGTEGSFELTEPVDLPQPGAVGETATVDAIGELTLNGVTRTVTVPLTFAYADADLLVVTGSFDVTLEDHEIRRPTSTFVVSIAPVGTVEIQLYLAPAA